MKIMQRNPWNWLKHEEDEAKSLPARRPSAGLADPLSALHDEVDRLFDSAFRGFGMPPLLRREPWWPQERGAMVFRPSIDITATPKEYVLTAEVPGMEEKDIKVELAGSTLTIEGEKKQEKEEKDQDFHRVERSYGSFQRVISLPEDADQAKVDATFKNGVLTVKVARKAAERKGTKAIEVKKG